MKTTYDKEIDSAYIILEPSYIVDDTYTYESEDGLMVNLDVSHGEKGDRNIVLGIEILGVKKIIK